MHTEYYRNLMAIVNVSNMTRAAQGMHVTQPTLSKQIGLLEKAYGAKLIIPCEVNARCM